MVTTLIVKSQAVKTDQPCKTGTLSLRQPNWPLSNTWSILSLTRSSPKNISTANAFEACVTRPRERRAPKERENSKRFKASLPHSPRQMTPLCLNTRWRDDPVSYAEFLISLSLFQGTKQGLAIRTVIRNILLFVSSFLSLFSFSAIYFYFLLKPFWQFFLLKPFVSRKFYIKKSILLFTG